MSGFGDKLRREREMRGVSLDEISESTKIGTRSLRALEEEDFEKLPGGIFNKGFVRAYSRFLGLDEEQTIADFDAAWREYQAAKGPPPEPEPAEAQPEPAKSTLTLLLAAILVTAAIGLGWYVVRPYLLERSQQNSDESPQNASAARAEPTSSIPPAGSNSTNASPAAGPPATSQVSVVKPSVVPAPASASEQHDKKESLASASPIKIEVFAREDSWLSISADGKKLGEGILSAQKSRSIHAQKEVKLRLGNVGGVEVSFNGKPVDIDGQPKQVKELTFTAEGLHQ